MEFRCVGLCEPDRMPVLRSGVEQFAKETGRAAVLECFFRREDMLYRVRQGCCDAAIVDMPGAMGMESARGVRDMDPTLPLVWISDDENFAMESYRLRARMFLHSPAGEGQIAEALRRCELLL